MKHTKNTTKLLAALLCLSFSAGILSACNQNSDGKEKNQPKTAEPVAVDYVWSTDYITLPEGISAWEFENLQYDGSTISFTANRLIDKENYEYEQVQLTYDFATGETSCVSAPSFDAEQYGYTQFTLPTPNGSTVAVFQNYDENSGTETWTMTAFDDASAQLWSVDLGAQFQELDNRQWMWISNCTVLADGTILAFSEQNIVALSSEGKRLFEIKVDNYIDNVFTTSDGTTYISYYAWDPMTGDGGYEYRAIDVQKKGLGDALAIPETVNLSNASIRMAEGYDLYYTNDTGLFALNFTDTEATALCNWVNSDLIISEIDQSFSLLSDELAVFLDTDPVSGAAQLAVMTPTAPEDVLPKYIIEVAYIENGSNMMPRYAVAFNRESDQYRVVLNDYSGYYDGNMTPMEALSMEIVAGDIPDIILCNTYELNPDTLLSQGLFRDLYSFMDAEGSAMPRDAFVPCVLSPMEKSDGTLPLLIQNFTLSSYAVKSSAVDGKTTWNIDDLITFSGTLGDDQYLFTSYFGTQPDSDPIAMQVMNMLLPYSLSSFIDESTATCAFDDGRFASLLQFCMEVPVLNRQEVDSEAALLRDGTLALAEVRRIAEVSDYLQMKYYMFGGEDMTLIGYPTFEDGKTSGTALIPDTMFGITQASAVADGAWEFICRTFGDVENAGYYGYRGFSSARGALESMFDTESRSYYIFEENGWSGTHYDKDEEIDLSWIDEQIERMGGVGVPGHMEEEDKAALMAIFEGDLLIAMNDETILEMIREDASAYFAGAKSLEETVKIIQSRVSIYVAEHN